MKKIAILILTVFFSIESKAQVTFETVANPNGQITLYILSQGYTNTTMPEFNTFTSGFIEALFATTPYNEFQQNFRVILVRDIATTNTFPRAFNHFNPAVICASGSQADAAGSETYATYNNRMDAFIATNIPNFNDKSYLLVVFNNDYYTAGGGRYTFTTDFACYMNPNLMYNVLMHEFSHSFGILGDEYVPNASSVTAADFPLFFNRNITQFNTLLTAPWNYLINVATPIITCSFAEQVNQTCTFTVPGIYVGANYSSVGWFKSQPNCKMNNVSSPFCLACQDILREKITEHLCSSTLTFDNQFVSRHQYITHWRKASSLLSSASTIGNTISVNYVSGNSILLTNGFASNLGSDFWGYIGNCDEIAVRNQYRTTSTITPPLPVNPTQKMSANNVEKEVKTIISPNPSNDFISIDANNQFITNIELFTIDGKLLFSQKVNNQNSYSLSIANYAKGTYIVAIQTVTGEVVNKKLIKE